MENELMLADFHSPRYFSKLDRTTSTPYIVNGDQLATLSLHIPPSHNMALTMGISNKS